MTSLKLIKLLKTLDKKELIAFQAYLQGCYANKNQENELLKHLQEFAPAYKSLKIKIDYILQHIFCNASRKQVLNLASNLFKFLEEFLVWELFKSKQNNFYKERLHLNVFETRNLMDWHDKKLTKLTNTLKVEKNNPAATFQLIDLTYANYYKNANQKIQIKKQELDMLHQALDNLFVGLKLKFACESMQAKNIYDKDLDLLFLEEAKNAVLQKKIDPNILNDFHIQIIALNEQPDLPKYQKLKILYKENYTQLSITNQGYYYVQILNYIASEIKQGNLTFIPEVTEWVNFGINTTLILEKGFLPVPLFFNFISVLAYNNQFKEAHSFSVNYLSFLKPKEQKVTKLVASAEIQFHQGQFDTIVSTLKPLTFINPITSMKAKWFILMTLYETKKENALIDYFHTYEVHFSRTKKIGEKNRIASLNLLKFTKKLHHLNWLRYNKEIDKIATNKINFLEELEKSGFIFFKSWLLKKIKGF